MLRAKVIAIGALSGVLMMALLQGGCIVYQDWRFLHMVRIATEANQVKVGTPAKAVESK